MINIHHHAKFGDPNSNGSLVMKFILVIFTSELFSSGFWQTDRQNTMHKHMLAQKLAVKCKDAYIYMKNEISKSHIVTGKRKNLGCKLEIKDCLE